MVLLSVASVVFVAAAPNTAIAYATFDHLCNIERHFNNVPKSITLVQNTHCNNSLVYRCFTWALGAELAHTYQGLV